MRSNRVRAPYPLRHLGHKLPLGLRTEDSELGLGVCTTTTDNPALNTKIDAESGDGGTIIVAVLVSVLALVCCFGLIWFILLRRRKSPERPSVFENPLCEIPDSHPTIAMFECMPSVPLCTESTFNPVPHPPPLPFCIVRLAWMVLNGFKSHYLMT